MSSEYRLTRSFRMLSGLVYSVDVVIALIFAFSRNYLHFLVGILTSFTCLVMLLVSVEAPGRFIQYLETNAVQFPFTFRGRYLSDLFSALFLFAMGAAGIAMACVTLLLVFGIRFLGVRHPEAFGELFRQPAGGGGGDDDAYTDAGGTFEGSTIESVRQ